MELGWALPFASAGSVVQVGRPQLIAVVHTAYAFNTSEALL